MKKGAIDIALIIIAAIFSVGVMTVFHACEPMEDGMWMSCHFAQLYSFYIGIALTVLSLLIFFVKQNAARLVLRGAAAVIAAIAVFIPNVIISLCMMDTMRCHELTKPFVRVISVLFIVVEIIAIFLELSTAREASDGKGSAN